MLGCLFSLITLPFRIIMEIFEHTLGHRRHRKRRTLTASEMERNREINMVTIKVFGIIVVPYIMIFWLWRKMRIWLRVPMIIWSVAVLFITIALFSTAGTPTTSASTRSNSKLIPVTVSKETDGDTIHVRMPDGQDKTIRMLLIDTPEDVKPGTPIEPYSLAAAHYAAKLMPVGKHIYIQEGVPGHQLDKYGRLLSFVYITPKNMYNEDVVKSGLARVAYIYPPNTQHLSALKVDQTYAKKRHLGIWKIPGYVTSHGYNMDAVKKPIHHTSAKKETKSISKGSLSLLSFTSNVSDGQYAIISVHAKPDTTAIIEVDYKNGPSHARGIAPEKVNAKGIVTWRWKIGSRTTSGNWPVIITDAGSTLHETLHVR